MGRTRLVEITPLLLWPQQVATLQPTSTLRPHTTLLKVVFDTEVFDTDGTYDHSIKLSFYSAITLGKYWVVTISLSMADSSSFTHSGRAQMFFNGAELLDFTATVGELL